MSNEENNHLIMLETFERTYGENIWVFQHRKGT